MWILQFRQISRDHLAAHGAGLAAGQVSVVALLQIDTHLGGGFHLELIHSGAGLGNVDLVGVLTGHNNFSFSTSYICGFLGIASIVWLEKEWICENAVGNFYVFLKFAPFFKG